MKHIYKKRIYIYSNGESLLANLNLPGDDVELIRNKLPDPTEKIPFSASDLVILPLKVYLEQFSGSSVNGSPDEGPGYIVLVRSHEFGLFSSSKIGKRSYPVFQPFSHAKIKALIKCLTVNGQGEALKDDNYYKTLFEKGPFINFVINAQNGRIVECNESAASFYQKEHKELLGNNFFDLHPDVSESLQQMIFDKNYEDAGRFVIKLSWKNQEVKNLEFTCRSIYLNNENLIMVSIQDVTQSVHSGELLHQQHEMLRSTLASLDDLFFTMNRHGEFIEYYQPGNNNQLSLSSDLFVGKSIKEVGFPEDVAQKFIDAIDIVLETGRIMQLEYHLDAFGTRLWYNAKVTPRRNSLNIADGVTVLCRDVTRQKKTEENLIRARDFYLTLFEDFPSMIWKTNSLKKPDYFNKTWLAFTGRTLEQEINSEWIDKIHHDDAPRFLSVLSEAFQQRKPFQIEHRLRHHDGSYRWIIDVGRPFNNLDGQFGGFIGVGYDITERRNNEDMLRIQRSALDNVLEGMLIIEARKQGNPVIYANKELSQITGIGLDEINGMDFLEVIGLPDDNKIISQIHKAIEQQKSFKGEFSCLDSFGLESWRLLLIAPVHDRRGAVAHFVVVLADISESKNSEKILLEKNRQLEKTNAELDSFVYSTSHELRSPLMSVLGLINLLEMEAKEPGQDRYIQMIKDSINKLDRIIHDIIDYSRNSRFEVYSEKVNFSKSIQKIISNLKYIPGSDKINYKIDVDEKQVFFSDVRRIEIIINNFLSNSIKYHNYELEDPFIEIRVKTLPEKAMISVKDNGCGIPESHLPRIYDMFFRGSSKSNGGGIGLYIVKEIVEKLQGTIDVSSVSGKFTEFVVEIPNQN